MRHPRGLAVVAAAIATAVALSGCGENGTETGKAADSTPQPATSTPPATAATTAGATPSKATGQPVPVPEVLQFEAKTLDGKAFDGRTLAGKPVVFWFWAPWCPLCRSDGPNVAAVEAEYGDRVTFVGVAGLDQLSAMKSFVADTGTGGFTQLNDEAGEIWRKLEIATQSSFAFVKADGSIDRIVYEVLGRDELERRVRALIEG